MRRHAKASPASSGQRAAEPALAASHRARGLFGLLCLFVLGLAAFVGSSAPAAGAAEGESCPNEDRRVEQYVTYLSDCRAYEMVSPPAKNKGYVARIVRAADDGELVTFKATGGFEGAAGAHAETIWRAERGTDGWSIRSLDAPGEPRDQGSGPGVVVTTDFSTNFLRVIQSTNVPLTPDPIGGNALYRTDFEVDPMVTTWLSRVDPELSSSVLPQYGGASSDLRRVFFTAEPLFPGAPPHGLYEASDGDLRLVSVLPDGTTATGSSASDPTTWSPLESTGSPSYSYVAVPHGGAHPVSDDGTSLFWANGAVVGGVNPLYLSREGESTVAVTASQRSGEVGVVKRGRFVGATHDHSIAYIVSGEQLTDGATATNELYKYESATGQLTLLTASGGSGAQIETAMMSDDGSHVYFIGTGALAPGAQEGSPNAYVWSGGRLQFIATLDGANPVDHFERLSTDGRYAVLATTSSLAGANNAGKRAIYLYDDAAGTLSCVSCRPDHAVSTSDAFLGREWGSSEDTVPLGLQFLEQVVRNVTSNGQVFFMTSEALLPRDINGVTDVYEWDRGHISLLSTGRSEYGSYLGDNGDNGRDVFILTRSRLVAQDTDDAYDAYDVRSGGGFRVPAPPVDCIDSDCQGSAAAGISAAAVGTSAFHGRDGRVRRRAVVRGVHRLSRRAQRRLASGRKVWLKVNVDQAGRVLIVGRGRVHGHYRRVIAADSIARKAGPMALPLRLSHIGIRELRRNGRLLVRIVVRFKDAKPKRLALLLRAGHRSHGGGR